MNTIAEFYAVYPIWTVSAGLLAVALLALVVACAYYLVLGLVDRWDMWRSDVRFERWAAATMPPPVRPTMPPPMRYGSGAATGRFTVYAPGAEPSRDRPLRAMAWIGTGPVRGQVLDAELV